MAAPTPSPSCGPRAPRDLSAAALVAWLVAITAAAAALRLRHLGIQILGDDELHMLAAVTTRTLAELPETVRGNDFGIPLAMAYRAWSAWRPLDEWTLRAPMLACGVAAPALAVLLARRLVSARVALFLGMLLAVHPLFIFYSRYVRPYAVCLVLLLGATWLIDRWATERRRALLAGAACCSALACWCQPLAVIAVALLFGGALLAELLPCRSAAGPSPAEAPVPAAPRRPLAVVLGGTLALLLSLALFAPALPDLYRQFIVGKVGRGALDAEAVRRNAAVLAGLPGTVPALVFAALALAGAALLARRSGRRALLLVVPAVGQPLVILALQPAQLGGTLVLARYQFYVLPFWLLFAALALAWLARRAAGAFAAISARAGRSRAFPAGGPLLAAAFAAALWWWGPCRDIYTADNACAHHDVFQTFAFVDSAAWRDARAHAPGAPVHDFYEELSASSPPLVVEWPAPPDFPHDVLYLAQAVHRRPMKLLATPEEIWWTSPLLALENVVTLRDGEPSPFPPGTLVVLHRNPIVELAWFLYGTRWWQAPTPTHARALDAMSRTLRDLLGPPVFDDRYLMVFRQPG